jgi:uroporphyrinogen decarboxylase
MKTIIKASHLQRIESLLEGKTPDRLPVALWRHFPVDDQNPETLARATSVFQDQYDFDLIKITPASSFQIKDWGAMDAWKGNPEGTREYTRRVIQKPDDWLGLKHLKANKGWLSGQINCAAMVAERYTSTTPVLQTVFSPLAQAKNLAGGNQLIAHIRQYPDVVMQALNVITETTIGFVEALLGTKISGIFYAVQHAQSNILTPEEFSLYAKSNDLAVLQAARPLMCNLLHVHGENLLFDQISDYPVQIINWHDQNTPPSLKDALDQYPGVVCGGLQQWQTLVYGDPQKVKLETRAAIKQTGGHRFLLGTGCVTPIIAPIGNLLAARHSVGV